MNRDNLRKALDANRFYYARIADSMRPAHERVRDERKRMLTGLAREMAGMEMRMQALEEGLGYKYNPDQPRVPAGNGRESGEWANAEGVTAADRKNPRFKGMTDTQIKKQKFVDAHLAAAEAGAKQLNVPAKNILGFSALESGWGVGNRFAREGNNFFGLHYPAPFSGPPMYTLENDVPVATFGSYEDSMNSFIARQGDSARNISDPTAFAEALQNSGKFGINPDGTKVPTYVPQMVATIRGLSPYIDSARTLRQ